MKNREEKQKLLLSADDVMELTGMSRVSVYKLLNDNNMPVVHIGARKFMHRKGFEKWLESKLPEQWRTEK